MAWNGLSRRAAVYRRQIASVVAAGGRPVMPRTVGPEFGSRHILVFTTFLDPAGNEIGLVETPAV